MNAPEKSGSIERIGGGVAVVWLTRGLFSFIDEDQIEAVSGIRWSVTGRPYARAVIGGKAIYMHRRIMNPPDGVVVNHLNWNTLDNRRSNLEVCTQLENVRHRDPRKFTGTVDMMPGARSRPWRIRLRGKHLGQFATEQEAKDALANILAKGIA